MQTPGTIISAAGHTVLIGWLLLGWGLDADPLEFDTMTVTTVSGEEFEALNAARTPDPGTAEPDAPVQPQVDEAPTLPAESTPTEVAPPPDPIEQPLEDTPPPDPPVAAPVTDVTDTAPSTPSVPAPTQTAPDLEVSEDPTPRQADVVTSTPTAPPPPDAAVDDVAREQAVQEPDADPEIIQDEQDETAPEETTTEIVNQDDTPSTPEEPVPLAPTTSVRPVVRPNRPAPVEEPQVAEVEEPTADPQPTEPDVSVEDVLAGVVDDTATTPVADAPNVPLGQVLSGTTIGNVQSAIGRKWIVDVGGESANITVTVAFSLTPDGKLDGDVSLVNASAGSPSAQEAAFQNARRALWSVSRTAEGFPFPADKYEQWRRVEATFDPSGVRLR